MRTRSVLLIAAFVLCAFFASAADLTIDMQVNTAAKDYANNYFTFKGGNHSADKDQFVLAADGTTGASKLGATELFNTYRFDVRGKNHAGRLRSLFLYPVADDGTRTGDNLQVSKAADGTVMVRYVHRGTAYEIVTDKTGALVLPTTTARMRKIGHSDNQIHADFSSNGKTPRRRLGQGVERLDRGRQDGRLDHVQDRQDHPGCRRQRVLRLRRHPEVLPRGQHLQDRRRAERGQEVRRHPLR